MMIGTLSAQGSSFSHCNEATQARENQSTKSISAKQSDEEILLSLSAATAAQSMQIGLALAEKVPQAI
jgi:hypothetical protein